MKKTAIILIIALAFFACGDKDTHTHEWEWKVTTPATPTADGLETETCKICGATNGTRPIAKLNVTETHTVAFEHWGLTFDIKYEKLPSAPTPEYVNYLNSRLLLLDDVMMVDTPNGDAMDHLLGKGSRFTITIKYGGTSFNGMNWNTATQEFEIHHDWISTATGTDLSLAIIRTAFNAVETGQPHETTITAFGKTITVTGDASIAAADFNTAKGKLEEAFDDINSLPPAHPARIKVDAVLGRNGFKIIIETGNTAPNADANKSMTIGVDYLLNNKMEAIADDIIQIVFGDDAFAE